MTVPAEGVYIPQSGTVHAPRTTGELPFVSVIVPVYNDAKRLRLCLDALARQTYPAAGFEILVVDNDSDDDVPAACSPYRSVHRTRAAVPGSFAARNEGLALARGDVIGFTDADCVPAADWIDSAVARLAAAGESAVVFGSVEVFPGDPAHPRAAEVFDRMFGLDQAGSVLQHGTGATANLWAAAATFRDLGGFDARLKSGGDVEFSLRARRARYAIHYAEEIRVRHPARSSFQDLHTKTVRVAGGQFAMQPTLQARWALTLRRTLPPLRQFAAVMREPGLTVRRKVEVMALALALRCVEVAELAQLHFGKAPERR
jgi:hypothetical protein